MLSHSVVSNSLQPHGPLPAKLLCPCGSSRQYWGGLPFPSPGDILDLGIEPRSPTWQVDSSPSEPPGMPLFCLAIRYLFPLLQRSNNLFGLPWYLSGKSPPTNVTQLCPTVCNPMDCSPSVSSDHSILQARILE